MTWRVTASSAQNKGFVIFEFSFLKNVSKGFVVVACEVKKAKKQQDKVTALYSRIQDRASEPHPVEIIQYFFALHCIKRM